MLDNALDYGISEKDFWEMTFAELDRLVASKARMEKFKLKERATFDYILASLIGRSFAVGMDSKIEFPKLEEIYPSLFNDDDDKEVQEKREIKKQELKDELSALRFR